MVGSCTLSAQRSISTAGKGQQAQQLLGSAAATEVAAARGCSSGRRGPNESHWGALSTAGECKAAAVAVAAAAIKYSQQHGGQGMGPDGSRPSGAAVASLEMDSCSWSLPGRLEALEQPETHLADLVCSAVAVGVSK